MNLRDNSLLSEVGSDTPMGRMIREYWIPACLPSELEAGGAPMRLMLLGEKLIAFRTPEGVVGIMDHACPHRCASLLYSRNESGGLRCVYHGWKFAPGGQCLEQPNVPEEHGFAHRLQAPAYPCVERNGVVCAYMGRRETPPPLTAIEATMLPETDVRLSCSLRRCNYLQVLEGAIDTNIVLDAAVPMDDEHTMIFTWMYRKRKAGVRRLKDGSPIAGLDRDEEYLPNGTGWFDRWRTVPNADNDYLIERDTQRTRSFTGMAGVQLQDQAAVESMGPVANRSKEHLSASDHMIVVTRKRMLAMVRAHQDGVAPPGLFDVTAFQQARSGAFLAQAEIDWRDAYAEQIARADDPTGVLHCRPEELRPAG